MASDTWIMDGKIPLGDMCRVVGIDEEKLGEVGEAETLAGMLLAIKGDFPQAKEVMTQGGCRFQVLKLEKHRITKVKVSVLGEEQEES